MNKEDIVLKKIKTIELKTRKLVSALNLGDYKSVVKGQGMTFSDFREYVPGDDVRNISWSLIAKTGKPYIKQYEEERELNLYFLMDTSYSMYLGQRDHLKIEQALYTMAALAMSAQKNNDLSGLILFSQFMHKFIQPKKGSVHVRRMITEVLKNKPEYNSSEGLSEACNMLQKHQKKKSIVFIFSDFLNLNTSQSALLGLTKKHQVVACVYKEQDEMNCALPNVGQVRLRNAETSIDFNSSASWVRQKLKSHQQKAFEKREYFLKRSGLDVIEIFNHEDVYKPVLKYFKGKAR